MNRQNECCSFGIGFGGVAPISYSDVSEYFVKEG